MKKEKGVPGTRITTSKSAAKPQQKPNGGISVLGTVRDSEGAKSKAGSSPISRTHTKTEQNRVELVPGGGGGGRREGEIMSHNNKKCLLKERDDSP